MENIHVLVRVRPLNQREAHLGANACITTNANSITLDNKKEYTYDHVLGADSTQEQVFDKIGNSTLQSFLDGLNCCIFAYGQTGAGKTYTMQGKGYDDLTSDSSHVGLQPRLIQQLFKELPKENNWTIKCTYLEIYNEQLIDLLNGAKAMPLTIREDSKRVYVENLTEIAVTSFNDVLLLMQRGLANRHVSATQMNLESSRSHSIFTLQLEQRTKGMYTRKSKMNFVDLAGSERQKLTAATGDRLKEATNINKSLTVLGLVINSLAENAKKFIPYRDSKLTFLLRESLGGNSKTVMIHFQNSFWFISFQKIIIENKINIIVQVFLVNSIEMLHNCMIATISAASSSFQETLGTLKFASRAKNIKNQAIINEEIGGNLDSLKAEIKRLKNELQYSIHQSEIIPKKQKEVELISQITSLSYQLNESSQYQDHLTKELKQMKEHYESRITELEDYNIKSHKCSQIGMQDKDLQLEQALEIQMELKYKNEYLNQRVLELQQEDTILKHRRNEQQLIITQLEQNIELLQKEKEMLLDQYQQQATLTQQYESQLEMFQEDKAHQLQELENRITELNDQLQINKDQMDTDAQTIEFQSEEIQRLQNDIELNKSLLQGLQSDCSNLHTQMAEKETLIKDQLKELLKFKRRSELKSKKVLKSLKALKKEKENFTKMEQKQIEFLSSLNTTMELEAKQLTNEFIKNALSSKLNQVKTQFDMQIQESQLLNEQKIYYSDLQHQTQNDLDEVKRQNEELKVELEKNKVNFEGVQKYGQLKEEFQYQKEKLSRFLDSFDIINQKLIMKENEVLKLRSELKLEQTQRSKSLEEIDKLRTAKIELSTLKAELEQTIQQLQCCNQNETDDSKQKKLSDNVLMLQKANQKLNTDLSTLQRQYKQLHEEKNIMQQKYEEKLMYQTDISKLRKDINITNQLKQQLDKKEREFQSLVDETQILEDFFNNINVKRFCNYQIQNEGTLSEKVKSYFEFLDQCEQEFEKKQFQLKTNLQQLRIEQANCNIVKEENRMLKMQLKI